ncbi:MAG: hypothetical protein R6U96_11590 [Promethearchaeia archaeon]
MIETDLKKIKELGKERERENLEFRTFLKVCDVSSSQIDEIVHGLYEDFLSKIDCKSCRNCCNTIFKERPCPFLKDNRCQIHEVCPKECRAYPYLHKSGFTCRLLGVVENYSICPIVFNVYEALKRELWHF